MSAAASIVPSAAGSDFPIENLPYGMASADFAGPRAVVAIGDYALDCHALVRDGVLEADGSAALGGERSSLNDFAGLECESWAATRSALVKLLSPGSELDPTRGGPDRYLLRRTDLRMHLPVSIGDYTDFYSSIDHARNVGAMFRGKDNALMPNWTWLPVGYHGRASSVVVSGAADPIRPCGQVAPSVEAPAQSPPHFGPSAQLDYELELGCIIGGPENPVGHPVPMSRASRRIFGCVLVNDWSARDLQRWEYVPLGPFTSKNFLTTMSPWVVPMAALDHARCARAEACGLGEPAVPYLLQSPAESSRAALDIALEVSISRPEWSVTAPVCSGNAKTLFWSFEQQIAHHTVTGCNLRPGDLLATGTISGPSPESAGCLLERTWKGEKPVSMPDGTQRTFLLDGDTVTISGVAPGPGGARIGFGSCSGTVRPSGTQ
mmetsp:Transcript_187/g.408  ORF Transcript_187/g.408 Transcript_187/m.408 type:complete len:435 (-) Transcript_187:287-1591(-)